MGNILLMVDISSLEKHSSFNPEGEITILFTHRIALLCLPMSKTDPCYLILWEKHNSIHPYWKNHYSTCPYGISTTLLTSLSKALLYPSPSLFPSSGIRSANRRALSQSSSRCSHIRYKFSTIYRYIIAYVSSKLIYKFYLLISLNLTIHLIKHIMKATNYTYNNITRGKLNTCDHILEYCQNILNVLYK